MDADLYLASFRRQEHELRRQLEHDRVALERAGSGRVAGPVRSHRGSARTTSLTTAARAAAVVGGWARRGRASAAGLARTVDDVAAAGRCCAAA